MKKLLSPKDEDERNDIRDSFRPVTQDDLCRMECRLERVLLLVLEELKNWKCGPRVRFDLAFGLPKRKVNTMQEVTITNEQKISATLNPKTDSGKPAKLDGAPKWSVVSGDSTVVPAADGLSADLVSSDTPGDTVFLVDGDADLGSGVEDVQETITLHVAGANAKNLGIAFGTPTLK